MINTPSIYISQYQDVYDAFTTKPSGADAALQNTMVTSLVGDGVWAKLDVLHIYAIQSGTESDTLINWLNPGTFDGTATNFSMSTGLEIVATRRDSIPACTQTLAGAFELAITQAA